MLFIINFDFTLERIIIVVLLIIVLLLLWYLWYLSNNMWNF